MSEPRFFPYRSVRSSLLTTLSKAPRNRLFGLNVSMHPCNGDPDGSPATDGYPGPSSLLAYLEHLGIEQYRSLHAKQAALQGPAWSTLESYLGAAVRDSRQGA